MNKIEVYESTFIESFLWENRKNLEYIKCGIYKIKNIDLYIYINQIKTTKGLFNNAIFKNIALNKSYKELNVNKVITLFNGAFMLL